MCGGVHWLEEGAADASVLMGERNLLDDAGDDHGVQSKFAFGYVGSRHKLDSMNTNHAMAHSKPLYA